MGGLAGRPRTEPMGITTRYYFLSNKQKSPSRNGCSSVNKGCGGSGQGGGTSLFTWPRASGGSRRPSVVVGSERAKVGLEPAAVL
jgi:hypothetical protein